MQCYELQEGVLLKCYPHDHTFLLLGQAISALASTNTYAICLLLDLQSHMSTAYVPNKILLLNHSVPPQLTTHILLLFTSPCHCLTTHSLLHL